MFVKWLCLRVLDECLLKSFDIFLLDGVFVWELVCDIFLDFGERRDCLDIEL